MAAWSQRETYDLKLFDVSDSWNLNKYGTSNSPSINVDELKNIDVNLQLYVGGNDILADETDLQFLYDKLNHYNVIKILQYGHCDFFWDENADVVYLNNLINNLNNLDMKLIE